MVVFQRILTPENSMEFSNKPGSNVPRFSTPNQIRLRLVRLPTYPRNVSGDKVEKGDRPFFSFFMGHIFLKFSDKFFKKVEYVIPCFRWGLRGGRYTKFEVNQTNLNRVILPGDSSTSSGALRSDVSLTSSDVRPDMTTKSVKMSLRP